MQASPHCPQREFHHPPITCNLRRAHALAATNKKGLNRHMWTTMNDTKAVLRDAEVRLTGSDRVASNIPNPFEEPTQVRCGLVWLDSLDANHSRSMPSAQVAVTWFGRNSKIYARSS